MSAEANNQRIFNRLADLGRELFVPILIGLQKQLIRIDEPTYLVENVLLENVPHRLGSDHGVVTFG